MEKMAHTSTSKKEKILNNELLQNNELARCILPDALLGKISKNVKFRPVHGEDKLYSRPLASKRLFIVVDNIEVISSIESPNYTDIDKPSYQVIVEESEHSGYSKLLVIETPVKPLHPRRQTISLEPIPGPSRRKSDSDESIYDYTTITELRTPKQITVVGSSQRRDTLPDNCFTDVEVVKTSEELQSDGIDRERADEADLKKKLTYLNSKCFMNFFQSEMFPNSLGKSLGFTEMDILGARSIPGKIFCQFDTENEDCLEPAEVVPCVAVPWPQRHLTWMKRRRDKTKRYQWPSDSMINEIQNITGVLVPKGFVAKRGGENPAAEIEWEFNFPKAERYLETRMSHAQVRCFIFLLAIFKTFIEPHTDQQGLLVEHIRSHIFWECEADYEGWPEHRLGIKLVRVIENFNRRLGERKLPHFFIRNTNMFENIPNKFLTYSQEVFHKVKESPVMYFLAALRNLRYQSGKFYPPFDFKRLHDILLEEPRNPRVERDIKAQSKVFADPKMQVKALEEQKNREKYMKKKQQVKQKKETILEVRRDSVSSIKMDWECDKEIQLIKLQMIIEIFFSQYVDIVKKSLKIKFKEQAEFYIKQASYIKDILNRQSQFAASELLEKYSEFERCEEECQALKPSEHSEDKPPPTPSRKSLQFVFANQTHKGINGSATNLSNLNEAYLSGLQNSKPAATASNLRRPQQNRPKSEGPELARKSVLFLEP